MAYIDYSAAFAYKDLLTYQKLNQLGANDEYLKLFIDGGLHALDTNASHYLIIKPGSDLTADRILTITTGDAARTLTLSGNLTVESASLIDQDLTADSTTAALAALTLGNSGLHILDTNASHDLIITPGSDLSADRILTITTGDAARTLTLSGNPTLDDWFDQSVKSTFKPTHAGIILTDDSSVAATKKLYLDGGGDTYITETSANVVDFYAANTSQLRLQSDYIYSYANFVLTATKKLFLDGGGDTYITETSANLMSFYAGNARIMYIQAGYVFPEGAGSINLGGAESYWNDISYKTLTDRGCLGWFDDGVELQDGTIVNDTEALLAIKKHPTKKTIYGSPMLDYKTFPKVSYKKADSKGVLLPRDSDDEPIGGADGVEMTSMFSIMIGAIKEIKGELDELKRAIGN